MWNTLTEKEKEYTKHAMAGLQEVKWAKPLLDSISRNGGLKSENMSLLFEVRFAYELFLNGISDAVYEYKAGVNGSTVEFMIKKDSVTWRVELL